MTAPIWRGMFGTTASRSYKIICRLIDVAVELRSDEKLTPINIGLTFPSGRRTTQTSTRITCPAFPAYALLAILARVAWYPIWLRLYPGVSPRLGGLGLTVCEDEDGADGVGNPGSCMKGPDEWDTCTIPVWKAVSAANIVAPTCWIEAALANVKVQVNLLSLSWFRHL